MSGRRTMWAIAAAIAVVGAATLAQDPPAATKPLPPPVRDAERAYQAAKRKADDEHAARLKVLQQEYAQKISIAHRGYDRVIDDALRAATRAGNLDLANQLNRLKQSAVEQAAVDTAEVGGGGGREFLSHLEHHDVVVWSNWFGKSGSIDGAAKITVNGQFSPNGISMVPPANGSASAKFHLAAKARFFLAHVALNDSVDRSATPLVFEVVGDGRSLWRSPPVQQSKAPHECRVDVKGVNVLEIRVNCLGPNEFSHAVWLEPRLIR